MVNFNIVYHLDGLVKAALSCIAAVIVTVFVHLTSAYVKSANIPGTVVKSAYLLVAGLELPTKILTCHHV